MYKTRKFIFIILINLVGFISVINADDKRVIPLDLYLIIDCSDSINNVKNDTLTWVYTNVVDRLLVEGDKVIIWSAGDEAQIIYNGEISASSGKNEIRDLLQNLATNSKSADFSGALKDLGSRVSGTDQSRLPYTMLVASSAEKLESALTGSFSALLRWSRSDMYSGWQILIAEPNIAPKVKQAAASYMSSQR